MDAMEIDFTRKLGCLPTYFIDYTTPARTTRTQGALNNGNWCIHEPRGVRST